MSNFNIPRKPIIVLDNVGRQLHAKCGPLLRIAPNEIACADPNAIKLVYRTQNALNKTDFYSVWNNQVGFPGAFS